MAEHGERILPRARQDSAVSGHAPNHLFRHVDPAPSLIGSKTWADGPTFCKTDFAQSAAVKSTAGPLSVFFNFLIFSCFFTFEKIWVSGPRASVFSRKCLKIRPKSYKIDALGNVVET